MSIVRFYIEKKTKVQFCDNTFKELKDSRIKNIENIITNISVQAIFWVKIYLLNVKKKLTDYYDIYRKTIIFPVWIHTSFRVLTTLN